MEAEVNWNSRSEYLGQKSWNTCGRAKLSSQPQIDVLKSVQLEMTAVRTDLEFCKSRGNIKQAQLNADVGKRMLLAQIEENHNNVSNYLKIEARQNRYFS